tara:strand:+ start:272 stop:985 length:714 start_codon:yes stop_codon:yes gene_type:complete
MYENIDKACLLKFKLNTNNELDFWRLNFEYIESEGITLYPWLNQFPEPVFPKKIRPLGMKGLGYDISLLDYKVEISSSGPRPNRWHIYYNNYSEHAINSLKNLSFEHPKNMLGYLKLVETDLVTGVKSIGGSSYWRCGVRLNCIYLELSNESWIYIQNDHPIITNEIDLSRVNCVYDCKDIKKCSEIYYKCNGRFEWIRIAPDKLDITIDKWVDFWGMTDLWNLKKKDELLKQKLEK